MADYLELLRADMADLALIERSRREPSPIEAEAFQIEMASLGVLVAVCTTLANRLAEEAIESGSAIALFDVFRPRRTAGQIAREADSRRIPDDLDYTTRAADERIEFAGRITNAWVHSERSNYSELVPAAVLADAWRNVCRELIAVFDLFNIPEKETEPAMMRAQCDATLRLLTEAMSGRAPCCDETGALSIPGWAERRAVHRVRTSLPAHVVVAGNTFPAEIVNVSRHGLGVACPANVHIGSRVEVVFSGRVLGATVKWTQSGTIGVRLDEQLDEHDVFFQSGKLSVVRNRE